MTIEEMINELIDYYDCEGYSDYYETTLKDASDEEIEEEYRKVFGTDEDRVLEDWERRNIYVEDDLDMSEEQYIIRLLERAANGDAEAQYRAAMYINRVNNTPADGALVAELLVRSAGQGYAPAEEALAELGMNTEHIVGEEDVDINALREQAEHGDSEAQYQMGLSLMGVEEGAEWDFTEAMEWMKKAADNGHEMAAHQLHFWTYAGKLRDDGLMPRNADWMEIMETLIAMAEAGDEEARELIS